MKKYQINEAKDRIDFMDERFYADIERDFINAENWKEHCYMNVTHVCDTYAEKYGIMGFVKKYGEEADTIRDVYGMLGTGVHDKIDILHKNKEIKYQKENTITDFEWHRLWMWYQYHYLTDIKPNYDILYTELQLLNKETMTGGTIDIVLEHKKTKRIKIEDWKTSKAVYESMYKQVSAYSFFVKNEFGLEYIPDCSIVLINPELNQKWIREYPVENDNRKEWFWSVYKNNLIEIRGYNNEKYKQPKFLSIPCTIKL